MSSGNAQIIGERRSCDYIERVVSQCVARALRQNGLTVYRSILFSFYSSAGWSKFIRGKNICMLEIILAGRRTYQFSHSSNAKKFYYLSSVILFCIEDVHNLLTPQEREKIFGEPFPQDGEQCEIIRCSQVSSVLHPISKQRGVAIYYLKSDHSIYG